MKLPVYLDNHATTRVDPRVVAVMLPLLNGEYGNAASRQHEFGWRAEAAVDMARERVAQLIGAKPEEIVFTSGATESINLALKGLDGLKRAREKHIVTVATEHRAVLDTCARLRGWGWEVTTLGVDGCGSVNPEDVARALRPETVLVSVMAANNEIGTIAPLGVIGALCRERGILFHTDASQAVGKIPIDVREMHIDMMSFCAHKMYGPKGVGALFIRGGEPRVRLVPQIDGGGHERGMRSGTLNVPGIAGFGKAAEIARDEMGDDALRTSRLRDQLVDGFLASLEDVRVNGNPDRKLPHNASVTFERVPADSLIMAIRDIAVSAGSACSSAQPEPSHVLRAIGLSGEEAAATIRFGLGRFTEPDEIEYTIGRVTEEVRLLREKAHHPVHIH